MVNCSRPSRALAPVKPLVNRPGFGAGNSPCQFHLGDLEDVAFAVVAAVAPSVQSDSGTAPAHSAIEVERRAGPTLVVGPVIRRWPAV